MEGIFGWSYPAGAANDPRAPWNQPEPICEQCGCDEEDCECDIEGQREAAEEAKADAMRERRDIERLERENDES